ncbi:NAD(P)/FAD-dependent oxidoreductase [Auritidibacter ignavus]|uniref:NAD(P)/FAD-dependent oxidoreductase n=1 Tax=Auritidibacter ignavus TaxID=678932 RepID=A0AAJ6DC24_9MICC|nr:NAD(P)/FAD-dependent oxidoreductase [Auritidibacter ignavus]WGH92701.1 NAD(P)/FAD-dependent oxidoreductase [Auritidibacter ignavus]
MTTAMVVGSGPNGLAAAVTLARAGLEVTVLEAAEQPGGGARSAELTVPGVLHDECSGFHPLAVDTAFSATARLDRYGLQWRCPEVQYAQPLDDGTGAAAWQDVATTAEQLGSEGRMWQRVFGPLSENFPEITEDFLQPMLHLPHHVCKLAHFGAFAGMPATLLGKLWHTPQARALLAGVIAHAFRPFGSLASSAIGIALGTAAHTYGWPVAAGGSQAISAAMIAALEGLGGRVETGVRVRSLLDLPPADVVMLDTSPATALEISGAQIPYPVRCGLRSFRHGPGAFVVNFAVEGGIPWRYEPARSAGTVHVGGTYHEVATAEREIHRGRMPDRPFVLLGQQYLADPGRSAGDVHPIDAYAHVPAGFRGDATVAIEEQIERFAPGFRDRIVGRYVRSAQDLESHNANYVGGDIVTGANSVWQLLMRPRPSINPYSLGAPGLYLCSAATPPGAGAHGMCGYNAAQSALAELRRAGRIEERSPVRGDRDLAGRPENV